MTIVDQSVDLAVDSDDESVDIFVLRFGETVIKIEDKNVFLKKIKYQIYSQLLSRLMHLKKFSLM